MKKSLVLAMAMALGVTASAYAANPFSDVPAGHWAYDSVSKLAAAGVIDGYGDGSFGGDKLMTRYEMAQIVARAMANGANVDKLAAEFADELDALGVRVAALEKKADNVKIAGTIKYQSKAFHASSVDNNSSNHFYRLRSDITVKGQINDDWTYTALLRNEQRLDNDKANKGEETVAFQRAYVEGKLGGLAVTAGRYNENFEDGNIYDQRMDGIKVAYGKDVKLTAGYAQADKGTPEGGKVTFGRLDTKLGVVGAHVGYYRFEDAALEGAKVDDNNIFSAGVDFNVAKDLKLAAVYLKSDADKVGATDVDDDGYVISLDYKGAKASKPGSYGIFAKYYDQGGTTYVEHTMDGFLPSYGFKGYKVGADYAFAKNIVGEVSWYGLEGQKGTEKDKNYDTLFAQVIFSF